MSLNSLFYGIPRMLSKGLGVFCEVNKLLAIVGVAAASLELVFAQNCTLKPAFSVST